MRIATASIMALALLCGTAWGQEKPGIPEDIIKELDGLVGTWEVEGKIGDVTETGQFTCRWANSDDGKKCCLTGRFSYKTGDKSRSGVTLIGWNAVCNCIEDRGFDVNGGNGRLLWTVESPNQWQGDLTFVEDGKELKSTAVLIRKGPQEIVTEGTTATGEASRYVFRKVADAKKSPADNGASKEQFTQLGDKLVGHWLSEFESDVAAEGVCEVGDKIIQSTSFEWVSSQTAILEKRVYKIGDKTIAEGVALISWDEPRKEIKSAYCDSLGGSWQSAWRKRGKAYVVQDRGIFGDGRKSVGRNILSFSDGEKTLTYKLTQRVFGDQTLPDKEFAHHRAEK
jgi:hypothetical protein